MKTITLNLDDAQADNLLAQLSGTGGHEPLPPLQPGYPKGASIGGVTYELLAPIHPLWLPSAQDIVFGSSGAKLSDPGMPRSPAGFPTQFGVPTFRGQGYPEGDARIIEVALMPPPPGDDAGYPGDVYWGALDEADWREFVANQDVRHRLGQGSDSRQIVAAAINAAYERHKGANPDPNYTGKLK